MSNVQPGWYTDPNNPDMKRYYDGVQWTQQTASASDPVTAPQQAAQPVIQNIQYVQEAPTQPTFFPAQANNGMLLAAFIFMLISLIASCWLIVPLAWMIPMTVHSWKLYKGTRENTVAFGVCSLLFVSIIAGIFMLIAPKGNNA